MTAHRVRLFYSTTGASGFHDWLSVWLTNMGPWASDEVTNEVPQNTVTAGVDGTGTEYYRVELAFDWTEGKAIILDNLDGYAASYCDWHRIGYHVCTHDDADTQPCSWETTRESGTPPQDIPTLGVT